MAPTNNEREAFAIADKVIKEAYQDFNNKGNGWWGDERIPNYGILRGAIAKAICEEQSKISQNEQQETVTKLWEALGKWSAYLASNGEQANLAPPSWLIDAVSSATSPHKQIPDGWKPIETVPKDGTQVIIKCSGGRVATAFYDDKPFVGEGWHVVVPFLGGFGSGTDTFIYFPEDMPTHWMPLPAATLKEKG